MLVPDFEDLHNQISKAVCQEEIKIIMGLKVRHVVLLCRGEGYP